jgi:hypothetical protein
MGHAGIYDDAEEGCLSNKFGKNVRKIMNAVIE